jgi:streptomycin 6-kinase
MARADIERYLINWSLQIDGACIETPTSWIQSVRRSKTPAILKLLKRTSDEQNAATLLRYNEGKGAVHLFDAEANALLMERATGTRSLVAMAISGRDAEAAEVLADTMATLHEHCGRIAPSSPTPLTVRFSSLFDHENNNPLLRRCADVARKLLSTESGRVPLHGDLHHGNVLDGGHRGWLAIDPKGLIGERTYDVANLLCNPSPHANLVHSQDRMNRLARYYARRLDLDPRRVLNFAFAHAGLSASWHMEDGQDPAYSLKCADVLSSLATG